MKTIIKYFIIFIVFIVAFVATLYITSLIPSSWLQKNVQESSEVLLKESNRKKVYIKTNKK